MTLDKVVSAAIAQGNITVKKNEVMGDEESQPATSNVVAISLDKLVSIVSFSYSNYVFSITLN